MNDPTSAQAVPHRAMRLTQRQVSDDESVRKIIDSCKVVRIGCEDDEGLFIVPMNFGYEWAEGETSRLAAGVPRLTLWLHCAGEGRKAEAFNRKPRVAIEMDCEDGLITGDYACAYSYAYRSIMGSGIVRPVTDAAGKRRGLDAVMRRIAPKAPITYSDEAIERVAVYHVDVDSLTAKQRAPKNPL